MLTLIGKLFIGCFKLAGYSCVFLFQVIWYLIFRKPDKIADAFGLFGRSVVDTFADMLKSS